MKTRLLISVSIIIISFGFNFNISPELKNKIADDKKIIGTYTGLNDHFEYVFKTEQGTLIAFQEIIDNIGVDLFDDATIGKKFEITWTELTVQITDDEGEPSGETAFVKRITSIKSI